MMKGKAMMYVTGGLMLAAIIAGLAGFYWVAAALVALSAYLIFFVNWN